MSTTAAQVTTFVYLLMQIACWLHVLFVFILSIYLFIYSKWCKQQQCKSPILFLFTYANWLLIKCGFHFNIQYLFVYLFKVMSITAAQITTCFYLLMEIGYWLHVVFVLIFSVYLFIYSKRCQQKQVEGTTCFYLLMEMICCDRCFSFKYWVSIYLFKAMSTKAGGTDHLFLLTHANHFLWDMVFVLIFSIYLFIYSKRCQQKQVEPTYFYLLMQIAYCYGGIGSSYGSITLNYSPNCWGFF